jgi:hypothetical protein
MLKYQLDSVEELDDSVKGLYTEKDGKFVLGIEGLPQPEDVSGLKSKVDELLAEKKAADKARKEAEEAARTAAEESARKSGDTAALEKSWQEKLTKREQELQDQISAMQGSVTSMTVDAVAARLASELALPGSADLLIPHIKSRLAAEQRDGAFITVVRDRDGKPSASSIDDLKNEFASNPAFAPVLVGSKATGGGASGGNGSGGAAPKTVTREQFDALPHTQKVEFSKTGGRIAD